MRRFEWRTLSKKDTVGNLNEAPRFMGVRQRTDRPGGRD